MFLIGFPLLVIPFAIYNMIAFLMPGVSWSSEAFKLRLMSGADWSVTSGDLLVAFAALVLVLEMVKSTRLSTRSIVDHGLSTIIFIGMTIEFLLVQQAASSTFFLLLAISFVDVAGGFAVTTRAAQRDIAVDHAEVDHAEKVPEAS